MKNKSILMMIVAALMLLFSAHASRAQTETPRYEVGAQFSSLSLNEPNSSLYRTEPGFGGRFTVNLTDYLAAEAETNFYPNQSILNNTNTAGRAFSGLFGAKIGKRYNRFGIYGKVRPGFVSFSEGASTYVNGSASTSAIQFERRRATHFATDVGGVLEFYPSRRIVTRFDVGDTIIRYNRRTISEPVFFTANTPPTLVPFTIPSETKHNFQFNAGIGYRF
jgi:beta-glucanase (GH16 family)